MPLGITVNVHANIAVHMVDPTLDVRLDTLTQQLNRIEQQGADLMAINAEMHALLDQVNTYTNAIAVDEAAQKVTLQEISDDLDDLIAAGTIDPTIKARLQAHADALAVEAANSAGRSSTLTAIAAKHEKPLPPPVEPPPVA